MRVVWVGYCALIVLISPWQVADGLLYQSKMPFQTKRMELSMKRGKGSLRKEIGDDEKGMPSSSSSSFVSSSINWCPIPPNQKLPQEEGKIGLLDTNLPTMKNAATNPTGAVGVARYREEMFCFASSCPSCKIPITRAKILPPPSPESNNNNSPRLSCGFCQATYNLKSGVRLATDESGGFFGGVVKSILSADPKNAGPLPTYKLGERNGKIVIAVD